MSSIQESQREVYRQSLDLEMLTESRISIDQWQAQAKDAARAYGRAFRNDPHARGRAYSRMWYGIFSIAEVKRAAKERWEI